MSTAVQPDSEPTLIFIPDISGFTEFVHSTEISHSRHIIEELLESIIDSNEIGLEISEIEGDAILFYRTGTPPTSVEILAQVQKMYVNFHTHIRRYQAQRICQCGACSDAGGLQLKFILHFGDVSKNKVKDFTKLFGRDIIVAHRLMKNDIDDEEYVLITHELLNACESWVDLNQAAWSDPQEGKGEYDYGTTHYCHLPLQPLMGRVPEPRIEDFTDRKATHCGLVVSG
ncbi:MAG: DUF2652 domain-containing protein, partial [Saprospiraceae bacterium]|nr:DUF2652 domain-containing protein [Saprospiraceae bacterium]